MCESLSNGNACQCFFGGNLWMGRLRGVCATAAALALVARGIVAAQCLQLGCRGRYATRAAVTDSGRCRKTRSPTVTNADAC